LWVYHRALDVVNHDVIVANKTCLPNIEVMSSWYN
jgi:hypothetical protein